MAKTQATRKTIRFMKTIAELYRDSRRQWRFRLKARNGEIIAVSEAYSRKSSAIRGAKRTYPRATIKVL